MVEIGALKGEFSGGERVPGENDRRPPGEKDRWPSGGGGESARFVSGETSW